MNTLQGRQATLAALRAAHESARSGRGQVVVLSGEPGIGKSAIANAFAAEVGAVVWGRAWEFADAPPYFPLWPCLRALGIEIPGADGARHDDELAFRLWETVLSSLTRDAARAPVVWIIEDLHAADLGSIDLLTFLAQPLRVLPALILATTRTHDPRLDDRKLRRLARMRREGLDLVLEPLEVDDVAALAEQTTGRALSAGAARRLAELTGGNPLFVIECARAAARAGGIDGAMAHLPSTVRQVVLDRVALLPDAARDALACGAVLGREFAAATIARMQDSAPALVVDVLRPALEAGILREPRPGQLAFSHALVGEAIREAISPVERVRLHGRAEQALAVLGDSADVLVERARHALAGAAGGRPEQALALAERAVTLLEREGAFDRAFALHTRIDEARGAGYLPPASLSQRLRVARTAYEAGNAAAARGLCEEVLAASRLAGDAEAFARAALLHATEVRVAVIDTRQIAMLEEALALLGARAPRLSARVRARLATALQPADDPSGPTELARQALAEARATGDDATILDVLDFGGLGAYFAPVAEKLAWAAELRDRALAARDHGRALTAWTWLAYWHIDAGDFPAFDRAVTEALALSGEVGHPRFRWRPLLLAAGRSLAMGELGESDRNLTEVAQIAALIDDPSLSLSIVTHEIMRARLLRAPEELRRALDRLDGLVEGVKRKEEFVAAMRAASFARLADAAATRAELARLDLESATREPHPVSRAMLAEAVAFAGTDEQRRFVRARLRELDTAELYDAGLSFAYEGTAGRVLGLLDAALGDLPAAEAALREALAAARARGQTPWIALLSEELAEVLRRAGRGDEARALAAARTPAAPDPQPSPGLRMERTGDVWTLESGGRVARVKDSRGMQVLARLVERPGEEIHVLALVGEPGVSLPASDAGEMLDDRARAAYRRRLAEIDAALSEAAAARDGGGAAGARLSREREAIARELARATGLGGRARVAGSATERARINVQRRLKDALGRIAEVEPELGRFLERAICTGTYCCFRG